MEDNLNVLVEWYWQKIKMHYKKIKKMVSCGTTPGNLVLTINQKIDENRLRPPMEVYLKIDNSKNLHMGHQLKDGYKIFLLSLLFLK